MGIYTTLAGFLGWGGSFGSFVSADGKDYTIHFNPTIAAISTVVAICSICLATYLYKGERQPVAERMKATMPKLHEWAYRRFYIDEIYQFITHRIIFAYISRPLAWFDRYIVDGALNGLADGANAIGERIRPFQSGRVQQYAYAFFLGAVVLFFIMII